MKTIPLLLLFFCFWACAQVKEIAKEQVTIKPGEVRWITFPVEENLVNVKCRDKEIKVSVKENKADVMVVETYFSDLTPFVCKVTENNRLTREIHFKVVDKAYKAEQLRVDPKRIKLSPKDQARADKEQAMLNKIYASSLNEFQFTTPFQEPLKSLVTSFYGTKRVYNKQKKGQHLGTDFRAAVGEKVPASNSGKVVFAGDLFYTGYTVILDHGLDIFTVYGHLSKTLVKTGDRVKAGQLIGLSGNSGRTSGPHLHWGVKVQGQYIDGHVLISESLRALEK